MDFSFIKDSGLVLLKHLSSILPVGADMHIFYASANDSLYRADYLSGQIKNREIHEDNELNKVYEIRRAKKNSYNWELDKSIFDTYTNKKNIQFKIEDENDHLILSMRFNSVFDDKNDVIYISFKPDLTIFGIEGGRISMNTENKTLIANMLYNASAAVLEQAQSDKNSIKMFTDKTKSAINKVKTYKEKLKQLKEEHHRNTISIAENFISGLSEKYCVSFIFTDDSIEALKDFNSNLPRLQKIVENAAIYAYNLNSQSKSKTIVIEEEYLEFSDSDVVIQTKAKSSTPQRTDKKEKVSIMLDKIEHAVKTVIANKDRINGVNVGKAFAKPISAAAITDFLKKRSDLINEILDNDPTRFPESRAHFRPLQNIIPESKLIERTG